MATDDDTTKRQDRDDGEDAHAADRPARVTRAVGRFRVEGSLGSGGMSDVYRAYDPVLDRTVALKVLRSEHLSAGQEATRMRRVVHEARAAAALTHPNTVTIFEVGEANDEVFIAMELLEGEDLRAVLSRGTASIDDKLRWLTEAARALGAAHRRGLVHRDVKPENMFVCKDGALKLLDFGIAKREEDDGALARQPASFGDDAGRGPASLRTDAGARFGTPRYMAPEQRAGEPTDPRTDQYAWGLVAFELLTGTHAVEALATVTNDAAAPEPVPLGPERLAQLALATSDPIATTIEKTLEPRREDRFSSMDEIVARLEGVGKSETARAITPPIVADRSPATDEGTGTGTGTGTGRRSLFLAGLVVVGLVAITIAMNKESRTPVAAPAPGACRVGATRVVLLGADDRLTVLPNHDVITARRVHEQFALQRELADGGVGPYAAVWTAVEAVRAAYDGGVKDLELDAIEVGDAGALGVVTKLTQDYGLFLSVWMDDEGFKSKRLLGARDLALSQAGKTPVVAVTYDGALTEKSILDVYLMGPILLHNALPGPASFPAIAATEKRIGVAYYGDEQLRLALFSGELEKVGDTLAIGRPESGGPSTTTLPVALALTDEEAMVFYTSDRDGKKRLLSTVLMLGETAFSEPKVAIDEPLSAHAPIAARLPNGAWALAWVASVGGDDNLRAALIGKHGVLMGPTTLATDTGIHESLRVTSTLEGVAFSWRHGATAKITFATCAAPQTSVP